MTVQDEHVQILSGLGHCGNTPFGNRTTDGGWYRSNRTLAGTVRYRSKLKGWTYEENQLFSSSMRRAVATMLKAQKVTPKSSPRSTSSSPPAATHPLLVRSQTAPAKMISDRMEGDEEEDVDRGGGEQDLPGMPLALSDASSENTIGALHERHLVRYILEFCHYDWFKDAEKGHGKGAAEIQIQTLMIMKRSPKKQIL